MECHLIEAQSCQWNCSIPKSKRVYVNIKIGVKEYIERLIEVHAPHDLFMLFYEHPLNFRYKERDTSTNVFLLFDVDILEMHFRK